VGKAEFVGVVTAQREIGARFPPFRRRDSPRGARGRLSGRAKPSFRMTALLAGATESRQSLDRIDLGWKRLEL
jgi:hypothetical protein